MEQILITGGCGFIGSNLINHLSGRYDIRILDNLSTGKIEAIGGHKVELVVGDIRDQAIVSRAMAGVKAVVHLAAQTGVMTIPQLSWSVNIGGTLNLLEAAVKHEAKRFIFASSNAVLGQQPPPIDENSIPRPLSPYGASKLAGEGYCSAFFASFGLDTVILRFSNVYGPGAQYKSSVIPKFIRRIKASESLIVYGDGYQTRDFLHVADICQAIDLALTTDVAGETFQIATGLETSILELIERLRALVPYPLKVEFTDYRAGDIKRNYARIDKAVRKLGYLPGVELNDGLTGMLNND